MTEIEKVLEKGALLKLPHWKIYNGLNLRQAGIAASSENGYGLMPSTSQCWESTKDFLKSNLDLLPPGDYTIHFKSAPDEKLDKIVHTFKITNELPAVNGAALQNQAQNAFNPHMLIATIGQTFQAQLATQNAVNDARFEKYRLEDKIQRLEEKLKKKESSGIKIGEVFDGIDKTIARLSMVKKQFADPPTTNIEVTGTNAKNVPGPEEKKEPVTDDSKLMLSEHLVPVNEQLAHDMIDFFGSADEMVINLYCLSKFLKEPDNAEMYELILKPKLAKYRAEITNGE